MIRSEKIEILSNKNDDNENPTIILDESPQRGTIPPPKVPNGCFLKYFKKFLSLFNPWDDYEEIEDFFEKKPMYEKH